MKKPEPPSVVWLRVNGSSGFCVLAVRKSNVLNWAEWWRGDTVHRYVLADKPKARKVRRGH